MTRGRARCSVLFEMTLELISQCREIFADRVPDDREVHAEVLVNQDVPHAGDVRPGNVGWKAFLIRQEMASGFADYFEIADDGVDGLPVGLELVQGEAAGVVLD